MLDINIDKDLERFYDLFGIDKSHPKAQWFKGEILAYLDEVITTEKFINQFKVEIAEKVCGFCDGIIPIATKLNTLDYYDIITPEEFFKRRAILWCFNNPGRRYVENAFEDRKHPLYYQYGKETEFTRIQNAAYQQIWNNYGNRKPNKKRNEAIQDGLRKAIEDAYAFGKESAK
jgi:hypothetical protein